MIIYLEKREYRGKRWKKGGKEEKVSVLGGKNMVFEKRGGAKISIIFIKYTPACTLAVRFSGLFVFVSAFSICLKPPRSPN